MSIFFWNTLLFSFSLVCVALFFLYPFLILVVSPLLKKKKYISSRYKFKISFIIVAHNADKFIEDKINNTLSLNYGLNDFEIIVYLDGCTDGSLNITQQIYSPNVKFIVGSQHLGKHIGLNRAVEKSDGDILIFSDVDAILEHDAVLELIQHFNEPKCGGVCGQHIIGESGTRLKMAQACYLFLDNYIKKIESHLGSISSNTGKLYAIRRKLFNSFAAGATDDLYQCLSIVEQGYQFIFEEKAKVKIKTPARNPAHELSRRRRIVCRSLQGIYYKKNLLNPFRYGFFSISLFINKILRRCLGFNLIIIMLTSFVGLFYNHYLAVLFYIQLFFYSLAASYPFVWVNIKNNMGRYLSIAWYFCLGNYATILGVIDFIKGEKVLKWNPQKADY